MDQDRETLEAVLVHATEEEVRDLSRYLQVLATIGNIAPILGLLGHGGRYDQGVHGHSGNGRQGKCCGAAGGIWEAMLTTALGLSVALPTMVAHSYLTSQWIGTRRGFRMGPSDS